MKRKADTSSPEHASDAEASQPKKKTKASESTGSSGSSQPTNKVLPVRIEFPPKTAGTLRLATWNICGLAASSKKGFKYYVQAEDADILVLTETKVNNDPVDPELTKRYPHRYWSIADKKSYSGTAILCKHKPQSVDYTLPGHPDPKSVKGRIVTLEFEDTYVIGTYVVNAGTGLKTLEEKNTWNTHFTTYIRDLDKKKPVIWTGDLNVAPTALDLTNPKPNWNKTPGYTEAETTAFARILDPPEDARKDGAGKFVDMWRQLHPDLRHYTYFSYRFNCRAKGIGWRLDTFVVSERLAERVKMCEIRGEIYGASDHCPVVLEISGDRQPSTPRTSWYSELTRVPQLRDPSFASLITNLSLILCPIPGTTPDEVERCEVEDILWLLWHFSTIESLALIGITIATPIEIKCTNQVLREDRISFNPSLKKLLLSFAHDDSDLDANEYDLLAPLSIFKSIEHLICTNLSRVHIPTAGWRYPPSFALCRITQCLELKCGAARASLDAFTRVAKPVLGDEGEKIKTIIARNLMADDIGCLTRLLIQQPHLRTLTLQFGANAQKEYDPNGIRTVQYALGCLPPDLSRSCPELEELDIWVESPAEHVGGDSSGWNLAWGMLSSLHASNFTSLRRVNILLYVNTDAPSNFLSQHWSNISNKIQDVLAVVPHKQYECVAFTFGTEARGQERHTVEALLQQLSARFNQGRAQYVRFLTQYVTKQIWEDGT
ncbi:hypothetical protein NM688_g2019 [Phlebia brevispora]|uniref:Uncharacterized protein n=1 Tax=Phlebia brevispora TaxID=194682 RepID=A0ACC1TA47_9APHY|nr:hypothetical protein NM688_g2019 [Phlebia brevispora]